MNLPFDSDALLFVPLSVAPCHAVLFVASGTALVVVAAVAVVAVAADVSADGVVAIVFLFGVADGKAVLCVADIVVPVEVDC